MQRKQKILDILYSLQRFGIKPGLERTYKILSDFGEPHDSFPSIHVAGTNGKGFTCAVLASVLMEAGYNAGLYTSPHIKDFNERIIVNGGMISDDDIISLAEQLIPYSETINATFFEITTAMAFIYLANQNIDIAIIETGMGGRFDSTNVLKPLLTIITDIGLEHQEYLGNSLEEIAYEKAGIIKENTPCVIYSKSIKTLPVFIKKSKDMKSPLFFADDIADVRVHSFNADFSMDISIDIGDIKIDRLRCPFAGRHQIKNLKLALGGLIALGDKFDINSEALGKGLQNIRLNTNYRCRLELVNAEPPVLIDTAHNPQAIQALADALIQHGHSNTKWDILYAAMDDKDVESILNILKPHCRALIITEPKISRAMNIEKIAKKAQGIGIKKVIQLKDSTRAYDFCKARGNPLIICGSFYLVGEGYSSWSGWQ